jgi:hypothetical protein
MENIEFKGYKDVFYFPDIYFDAEKGICEIAGESFLEDSVKFYSPYIEWIKEYLTKNDSLVINFKLTYFNTSSSKRILDILKLVKEFIKQGKNIEINWFFLIDDEDILMEVEDFAIIADVKINIFDRNSVVN